MYEFKYLGYTIDYIEKEDRGILGIWFLVKVMKKFLHATILFNLF